MRLDAQIFQKKRIEPAQPCLDRFNNYRQCIGIEKCQCLGVTCWAEFSFFRIRQEHKQKQAYLRLVK